MAESYRGLTIRIGGDSTKLQQALRAANQAASQTGQEIRKLNQATRLDPDNITAYALQVGFLSNQAQNTAMKLAQLKEACDQVANSKVTTGFELGDEDELVRIKEQLTDIIERERELQGIEPGGVINAEMNLAKSNAELRKLTESLASAHQEATELAAQAAKLESMKLSLALDLSDGGDELKAFKELVNTFGKLDTIDVNAFADIQQQVLDVRDAIQQAFDFDNGTVNKEALDELLNVFGSLPMAVRPGVDEIKELEKTIYGMADAYSEASDKLDELKRRRAEALSANDGKENATTRSLDNQIEKQKSAIDELVKSLKGEYKDALESIAELSGEAFTFDLDNTDPSHIEESLKSVAQELGLTDAQIENLTDDMGRLVEQFRQADTDVKKWKVVTEFQDLVVEIQKGEAQLTNFANVLASMKAPSDLARGMSEVTTNAQVLDDAFKSLRSAGDALGSAFKADPDNVRALEVAMDSYAAASMVAAENSARLRQELDAYEAEGIGRVNDSTQSATQALFDAAKAAEDAKRNLAEVDGEIANIETRMAELESIRKESLTNEDVGESYEEAQKALEEYGKRLEDLRVKQKSLREEESEASRNEQVAKKAKEYEDLVGKVAQFEVNAKKARQAEVELMKQKGMRDILGDMPNEIQRYGTALEAAVERAKALSNAVKLDPANVELMRAKTEAIAEVESLVEKRTVAINDALSKLGASQSLESLRSEFGSVEEAVRVTTNAAVTMKQRFDESYGTMRQKLAEFAEMSGVAFTADEILEYGAALDSQLTPAVIALRNEIYKLTDEWNSARDAMHEATNAQAVQDLNNELVKQGNLSKIDTPVAIDDAAIQQAFARIGQYAENAGRAVAESASTIDAAYRDMRKTVNGTEEEFESIREAAIAFSQTHAVSADQMLEMEALGGQLGIAASELQQFGEIASNLTIATDIGADDVALQLGQISNIMSDINSTDDMGHFADALVRLGNNAAAQESAIMNVAQRIAAVGNVTSMSSAQLLGWSAAIAETGMRSESAATAISNTITGIGKAVEAGGATLEQFANIAGMSAEQFKAAWENSSSSALEAFIKGLEGLTDDSTAAIAALDTVGISSVRQRTALLALSQTVENLDDNITMSQDAFEGVSDRWGAAGDAAREAQNKSEGFSGSLTILQQNASNLAASLGDGMVVPMQVLSQALKTLTDLLNALPMPLKTILVSMGGMTATVGVLTPAMSELQKYYRGFADAVKSSGGTFSGAIESLKAMYAEGQAAGAGANTAAVGVYNLGNALKAAAMATAITAVIAVLGALVTAVGDAIRKSEELSEAQRNLSESSDRLAAAAAGATGAESSFGDSLDTTKNSIDDTTEAINRMIERQEQLASTIEDRNASFEAQSAMVEDARSVIDEYANTSNLSYDAQAKLIGAVQMLNEELGTTYEVTDAANGVIREQGEDINLTTEQIDAYINKQMEMAKSNALLSSIEDAYKALFEAQNELAKAEAERDELTSKHTETMKNVVPSSREAAEAYAQMADQSYKVSEAQKQANIKVTEGEKHVQAITDTIGGLKEQYHSLTYTTVDSMRETADAIEAAAAQMDVFKNGLHDGVSLSDFGDQMAELGASTEDFANLTENQLVVIARAYDGSIESIKKALASLNIAFDKSVSGISFGKPSDQQVNDYKRGLDEQYTARKRELDAEYTAEKRAADAAYNARKRELDANYNAVKQAYDAEEDAFKKSLDKELDALKSELDKQYDARKTELDAEYELQKKSYDKSYNELKTRLDKEYNEQKKAYDKQQSALKKKLDDAYKARKKALDDDLDELKDANDDEEDALKKHLDSLYNARKKQYDKDYSAYKKSNDKILKELKKRQQKEVEQYKDVTNAYVAELKKQYDAQKKHLEENDGRKDIDDKIDALKDKTKAEQLAKKEADRQEKTSELQRAVEQAKTRKTRQEAEKALNDYLADIAQEHREEEREAEIERLEEKKDLIKEETDAKKSALDDERDARIEAYQRQREEELTLMQERQEEEYELLKEQLDGQNELYKERLDAKLAIYKEQLDAQLQALKDANAAEEEEQAGINEGKLEAIKAQQEAELEARKEADAAKLEELKAQNELELEARKEQNQAALDAIKAQNDAELAMLKEANDAQVEARKEDNEARVQAMKDAHAADLEAIKQNNEDELNLLKQNNEDALTATKQRHEDELTNIKNSNTDKVAAYKKGLGDADAEVKSGSDKLKESSKEGFEGIIAIEQKVLGLMPPDVRDSAANAMIEMNKQFDIGKAEAKTKTGEIRDAVADGLGDLGKVGEGQGANLVLGLKEGMDEKSDETSTKATDIAKRIKDSVDAELRINSPSEEMRERGEYVVEGLIEGMDGRVDEVGRSAESLANAAKDGFNDVDVSDRGAQIASSFADGIDASSDLAYSAGINVANGAADGLGSQDAEWVGMQFVNGFAGGMNGVDVWSIAYNIGMDALNAIKNALGIHSPSKEAARVGRYFMLGLEQGVGDEESRFGSKIDDVVGLMSEAEMPDGERVGADMIDGLVKAMREREGELARQMERMSKIVENGFDPRLTVDAAYEAVSSIRSGEMRRAAAVQAMSNTTSNQTVNINVNLSDVTIREDADIEKLAQRLAALTRRKTAAMLG